jgi:MoaA/NifB/PqqE/SkfB family radical SAM enzyme
LRNIAENRPAYNNGLQINGTGEALLDKNLLERVELIHKYLPKCTIHMNTTLGHEMPDGFFEHMIQNCLNHLRISLYGTDRQSYLEVHGVDRFGLVMKNLSVLSGLVEKYTGSFSVLIAGPFAKPDQLTEELRLFEQKLVESGFGFSYSTLHNFGKLNLVARRTPVKPCPITGYNGISKTLRVTWNMEVIPCCMVTDNEIVFGNLRKSPLRAIWYGNIWTKFREAHKKMDMAVAFPYCWNCLQDPWFDR